MTPFSLAAHAPAAAAAAGRGSGEGVMVCSAERAVDWLTEWASETGAAVSPIMRGGEGMALVDVHGDGSVIGWIDVKWMVNHEK